MCIFTKDAGCERLNGANVQNNDEFRAPAPMQRMRTEGLLVRDLFRGLLFRPHLEDIWTLGLSHIHRDVPIVNILRIEDEGMVDIGAADAVAERKPKEKKRKWRPAGIATGKELKQAKVSQQRQMKLQYKSDRTSNKSRHLPTRFTRR